MLDFSQIDTILLDMDGTLLDLNFDNQFWLNHVPLRYAEQNQLNLEDARQQLMTKYLAIKGQLNWYSTDYWTETLNLPISSLEKELQHLIKIRPDVPKFLRALKQANKKLVLLTNAHPKSMNLKLETTGLAEYLDEIYSTHQFGYPKEEPELWAAVKKQVAYDENRTLFIDDAERILSMAKKCGIKYLLGVENPDSQQPATTMNNFQGIRDYNQLLPLSLGPQ